MPSYRWSVFFTIENDKNLASKYIQYVTYYLPKCYRKNEIIIKDNPYLLSRTAYGDFVIGAEITFKRWTLLSPIRIEHHLEFKPGGKIYRALLQTSSKFKRVS
jgi:transcription initiation factor IIF auxiliary subunit